MDDEKRQYLEHFRKILKESYLVLKKSQTFPKEKGCFIEGFMTAGRFFGVSVRELEMIVNELNLEVFGMTLETRRKFYKQKNGSTDPDYRYYDIPTWIREGKKIEI